MVQEILVTIKQNKTEKNIYISLHVEALRISCHVREAHLHV